MTTNSNNAPFTLPMAVPGSDSIAGIDAPRRGPFFASKYAVATDHPLASLVAMDMMRHHGGNAADAVIAASAVNAVTKPHRTALGGDAFMLIWRKQHNTVDCLNAGGLAPHLATLDRFPGRIPALGPNASTIPGLVDAWLELHKTYATLPLDVLLKPAIDLCERGFPVSQRLSFAMTEIEGYDAPSGDLRQTFLVDGRRAYAPGEILRQPQLAEVLKRIVEEEREGFYAGQTGELIAKAMRDAGGIIDAEDLGQETALWHDPLKTEYRGIEVYEQALPSQGIILLESLNIIENYPMREWGCNADAVHVMVEATRLAFEDRRRYAADPLVEEVPVEWLLSKELAKERAGQIDLRRVGGATPALTGSDTTEFVVGDDEIAVAFIQSVFAVWGARFVVPGTGILMNNRLRGFSTDPQHPNRLAPGKRTVHTLNTFLALKDGQLVVGGGTPGADFQVQSNLQTIAGVVDWQRDLQTAIDAPHWVTVNDNDLALESRFAPELVDDLTRRGHQTHVMSAWDATMARTQVIASNGEGWAVASDLRGEGVPLVY